MSEAKQSQGGQKRFAKLNIFRPKSRDRQSHPSSVKETKGASHILFPVTSANQETEPAGKDSHLPDKSKTPAVPGTPQSLPELGKQNLKPSPAPSVSRDTKRTQKRYEKGAQQLEESLNLKFCGPNWKPFQVPKFAEIMRTDPLPQLRVEVEKLLNVREESINDRGFWSKSKNLVETIFTSTSPIVKNLLQIAKHGSAVYFPIMSQLMKLDDSIESVRITL